MNIEGHVRAVRRSLGGSALPRRSAVKQRSDMIDPLPLLMRISSTRFSVCIPLMHDGHLEAYAFAHERAGWWLNNPLGNPDGVSPVRSHKDAGARQMTRLARQVATDVWAH